MHVCCYCKAVTDALMPVRWRDPEGRSCVRWYCDAPACTDRMAQVTLAVLGR